MNGDSDLDMEVLGEVEINSQDGNSGLESEMQVNTSRIKHFRS